MEFFHIYLKGFQKAMEKFTTQEIDETKEGIENQVDTILSKE
jgi:hypothetical protein